MTSQPRGIPAQAIAAEQIRAAIANHHPITREYLDGVAENTGLTDAEVADVLRQVRAGQANVKPTLASVPAEPAKATDPFAAYLNHPDKTVARQAAKGAQVWATMIAAAQAYDSKAALRKRLAKLEAEAKKVRAELRGKPAKAAPNLDHGGYACPECDRNFHAPQGVALHRRRAHGGAQ